MSPKGKNSGRDTITADDVAARAGVSRWTVGRAFKPQASVSKKTRAKVMQAAEQLGYAPDLLAASLASDRSNLVAVLVDHFVNPFKMVMLERLTRILRQNGWDTLLVNTLDDNDTPTALLNASQRRVDAAVLIGVRFNDLALETALGAQRVRKLILFARYSESPDTISICCDDRAAMTTMVAYVLSRKYRRPHFLAGPQTKSAHLSRKETFLCEWHRASGNMPTCTDVPMYDPDLAYRHVAEYLGGCPRAEHPDILVCENDALAMGAVDALRYELGLRIPEDIAVTGFDDVPQAASPHYRLTTYRQPVEAMADGLIGVLNGTADLNKQHRYLGSLQVRQSA